MPKYLRIVVTLLIAACMLPACSRKQAPTPSGTAGADSGIYGGGDLIPANGLGGDFGMGAEGLELRGSDGIGDGYYNGRKMVEGVLPSVYFGFDSSSIAPAERGKLQQAADYLASNPSAGLLLEAHCDWYGTAEYNLALGDRRANSVLGYLSTLGVDAGRLETLSKGSLECTSGLSKAQSSQDRRADLIILE